jgi:pimeloyl-ACP methyl ester carboxylesterase
MPRVRIPGGPEIHYREWGRPDGAVVLLLHGLTVSSEDWRHVAPVLGEQFRVIAPDARGHGRSEWTPEYSLEAMRDDVIGFMTEMGILGAILVGHSMGGLAAYAVAAERPDLVRLLVLEDMPAPVPADPPRPYPRHPDPDGAYDWQAQIAVFRWRNNPPQSWWDLAGRITASTLVIGGTRSTVPQGPLEDLANRIPHGRCIALDRGHGIHEERPSEFLAQVQPFISYFAKA